MPAIVTNTPALYLVDCITVAPKNCIKVRNSRLHVHGSLIGLDRIDGRALLAVRRKSSSVLGRSKAVATRTR